MNRIVVTGAECTGKTTLVRALSAKYGAPWVPEAARVFVEREGRAMTHVDVPAVAMLFRRLRGYVERDARDLVLYDTDLLSTVVYARHYFGSCPPDIVREARADAADLYLLAGDDIPWRAEADQRGTETDREAVQALTTGLLDEWGRRWTHVSGPVSVRVEASARAIDRL